MTLIATITTYGSQVTLSNPDGTVISVQPDGSLETRPAGTHGSYELATQDGLTVLYQPVANGPQFLFSLV